MWKNLEHGTAHFGCDIFREAIPIAFAATKQQTPIMGQAEIIHHKFAVGHSHITGQYLGGALAQWFRGCNEVVDWHHPCRDVLIQAA